MLAQQNEESYPQTPSLEDEASSVLMLHAGDAKEAVMTLLVEIDALQERLQIARIAMGHGFTRGWTP